MGASSKGGMGGPNTAGPGGQGRDYNGNARGSNMPGEFNMGGPPRAVGGAYGQPIFGAPPAQGDLYQPGGNRFMPGGMVPPAGRIGNPRQFNPGQGGMRPGMPPGQIGQPGGPTPMPGQPNNPGDIFGGIGREVGGRLGRAIVRGLPGGGGGSGSGKGGMPGPGGPSIGMPVERPPSRDELGGDIGIGRYFPPEGNEIGGDGGGGDPGLDPGFAPGVLPPGQEDPNDPFSGQPDLNRMGEMNDPGFGGGAGLNARADGRDPFEFGEDPEFEAQRQRNYRQYPQPGNPAPVNRFQPRGMIPPAGGRIGNPRQVNPGQGPMQPGMPGGGGKGGMPGPGGPSIGMPVQRPGAPRNIVNQYTRQRTRPR